MSYLYSAIKRLSYCAIGNTTLEILAEGMANVLWFDNS